MALYLHVCQDSKKNDFLLISEQNLDASLPEIKAQIYFDHPMTDLKQETIQVVTYGISKKETEALLNFSQQRQASNRNLGLFAQGKVDKKNPFKIFSYPSVLDIKDILKTLHITMPKKSDYIARAVQPDLDHVLEQRHRVFWEHYVPLMPRKKIDQEKWSKTEAEETELLNKLNNIDLILTEQH